MKPLLAVPLLLVALGVSACGPRAAAPPAPAATGDPRFNAVWDSATTVLFNYRFTLDRLDRRSGVITTLPIVGKHWFEFWRGEAATNADVAEGTIQTIYRKVTVHIRPAGEQAEPAAMPATAPAAGGEFVAQVQVHTYRSDRTDRQVQTATEGQRMFLKPESITPEGEQRNPLDFPGAAVSDLGRDAKLEQILQQKINSMAAKRLTLVSR